MRKISTLISLLVLVLFSVAAFGQNHRTPLMIKVEQTKTKKNFQKVSLFSHLGTLEESLPQAKSALAKGTILDLKTENIQALYKAKHETIQLTLPLFDKKEMVVDLVLHQTLADGFQVTTSGSNGQPVDYEPGLYYRGTIQGSKSSFAGISIFEGEVIGVLSTAEEGDMILGKTTGDKNKYIFYRERDMLITNDFQCDSDHPDVTKIDLKKLKHITNTNPEKSVANCVNAYLECEHDMYQENGSVSATVDYMTGLYNVVATLYQNEQITTQISELFVWDTPDSYPTSSTVNALNAFRNARPNINGDVGHLISRGAPAGGGVAWVNALCSSYNYAYSYIYSTYQPFPTYSWSVEVVTHEMGHNLGSPHTHACAWNGNNTAIDGCGPAAGANEGCNAPLPDEGTIMSYCHLVGGVGINFNLGFGPQPGDLIRDKVATANCLSPCSSCNLTVSMTGTPANGGNNGTATANESGGTAPYTYAWSNGGSTQTITGLAPGVYDVTVNDDEGCVATGSYEVEDVTPCSDNVVTLTIITDNYPGETTWELLQGGNVVASGGPYSTAGSTETEEFCLEDGCYDFVIYDSYGDGICCGYGNGSYLLEDDATGTVLASGGAFGSSESTNFCVPVNGGGGCTYVTIDSHGFESGWGIWNDGGSDCRRNANDAAYATTGTYCARLRDNTNTSVMTTDNLDLASNEELTVAFGYYPRSMDNSNEDFWLQISTDGGASYTIVEEWNRNDEFVNNNFYTDEVVIAGPFSSTTRLRFRCDASGNSDWVYIDDVTISGCSSGGNNLIINQEETVDATTLKLDQQQQSELAEAGELQLFPNPTSTELTIRYQLEEANTAQVLIMDFTGKVVRQMDTKGGTHQQTLNVSDLNVGYYVIQVVSGQDRVTKKFVVAR